VCKQAGLDDFNYHDLRHCAVNNLRLAGNDYFRIMAMSGHKTMSVFKRYNLVTEEELQDMKWEVDGGRWTPIWTPRPKQNEKRIQAFAKSFVMSWCSERESNSHTLAGGGF